MRYRLLCTLLIIALLWLELAECKGRGNNSGRSRNVRRRGRGRGKKTPVIPRGAGTGIRDRHNGLGAKIVNATHSKEDYEFEFLRKVTFSCIAEGYPNPNVMWLKDGNELDTEKFLQVYEQYGNNTVRSTVQIDPATQDDVGYYECQAGNDFGVDRRGFNTDYITIEVERVMNSTLLYVVD